MKKLLLVLSLVVFSLCTMGQSSSHYTAVKTSLYEKYKGQSEYKLVTSNDNVHIPVTITQNIINIHASNDVTIKIYPSSANEFSGVTTDDGTPYKGCTWRGYDVIKEESCTVDIVYYSGMETIILAVNYSGNPDFNLRYYLVKD